MRLVDFHCWSLHYWVEKSPAIENMHRTISPKTSKTPTGWKVRLILWKSLHRLRDLSNTDSGSPQSVFGCRWHAGVVTKGIIYKQADRGRFLHWFCTSTDLNTGTKHRDESANCLQCYCCVVLVAFIVFLSQYNWFALSLMQPMPLTHFPHIKRKL